MSIEILVPAPAPGIEEVRLVNWLRHEGDTVRQGDEIAEVESDKVTMSVEAPQDGVLARILMAAGGDAVPVNTPIALLRGLDEAIKAPSSTGSAASRNSMQVQPLLPPLTKTDAPKLVSRRPPAAYAGDGRIHASPLARRLARERGVDLATIRGSGPRGRVIRIDIDAASAQPAATQPAKQEPRDRPEAREALSPAYADRIAERVPVGGMRAAIAAKLTRSKQTVPHYYLRRDVRVDELLALRASLNQRLADRGLKVSVNDFFVKACGIALQQVPECNVIWAGDSIVRLGPSDIAVAVAVDGGLYTPVVKDADVKSISRLSSEVMGLAERARGRTLTNLDCEGGALAISNLGMFGVDSFDAIINPPQAAILAVGRATRHPVVNANDTFAVGTVVSLTLSVDHRVIDGALGARLLGAIAAAVEDPMLLVA